MLLVPMYNKLTSTFALLSPALSNSLNISTAYTRNFIQPSQEVTFLACVHYYSPAKKIATFFIILRSLQNKNFL